VRHGVDAAEMLYSEGIDFLYGTLLAKRMNRIILSIENY
jgi:hypothetical protein